MSRFIAIATGLAAVVLASNAWGAGTNGPAHGMAMHGEPKYPADFQHFDYVNPDAPKGGTVVREGPGQTFDSLHPFVLAGNATGTVGLIYDTLTVSSSDEAFTQYCLLCETMEVPDDRSWVEYTIRDDARWHDGRPVTVDDVIFSFNILVSDGSPLFRSYWGDVADVSQTGPNSVRFSSIGGVNLELPLILGQLTVLPKHYWEERDFSKTTLEPPLGSGPYRIADVKPGRSITFERVEDYWGVDHPVNVGQDNFDTIRFEYFRDRDVTREAFKAGDIDIWAENSARNWATSFDIPAVREGLIRKEEIAHQRTSGMQGFVFNTRKAKFQDRRVRQALVNGFNFEWYNANQAYNAYTRTRSFFDNSELGSRGLLADAGEEEREILERYRGRLPDDLYTQAFAPPETDGTLAGVRGNLREARRLLEEAGYVVRDSKLVNGTTGDPFEFEIMLRSPTLEGMALSFKRNLERLGIDVQVRLVDGSQYQKRLEDFDFDVVVGGFAQSLSPGNEQRDFFSAGAADDIGTRNIMGVDDPVIDELIELVISAESRDSLVQRTRALDRALLWGFYLVPHFHIPHDRIAAWDRFGRPDEVPLRGVVTGAWWVDPALDASLDTRRAQLN